MITKPTRAWLYPSQASDSLGGLWLDALGDEQAVIVVPAEGSDNPMSPQIALQILMREEHGCGDLCGHCEAVRTIAAALFPAEVPA